MQSWPPLSGDYKLLGEKKHVAIVTLTSNPEEFAISGAAIVGSLKTENLGVERIIINTISNPEIRAFILCGKESQGHMAGQALFSVWKNGVDENMKIIGAKGPIPYLENITEEAVNRFRRQVEFMHDFIGVTDAEKIRAKADAMNAREFPKFSEPAMFALGKKVMKKAGGTRENMLVLPGGFLVDPVTFRIEEAKP